MKLSGWRRLSILLTAIWLLFAWALVESSRFSSMPFPIVEFLISGILPPTFLWGAWWVWRGFVANRKGATK